MSEQKQLEIKVSYWEMNKPNHGRVSTVHAKINRKQLEKIMEIIHETTESKDG